MIETMPDHTPKAKVALIALGCSKNLVDSENMTGLLLAAGYEMTSNPNQAEVIVVNTCGFIASAVEEAIDAILTAADFKKAGSCRFLVVTGCMAQRYYKDIIVDLPEVDAILGVGSYADIVNTIEELYQKVELQQKDMALSGAAKKDKRDRPILHRSTVPSDRLAHLRLFHPISTGTYAYLKIAEGCNKRCSYCAIPGIRGDLCSRPHADLIEEAKASLDQGVKELILVAQDTTSYGLDISGRRQLPDLLKALAEETEVEAIRFLYAYADGMTDDLLDVMQQYKKVIPYIDLPIQHAADSVLRRMGRSDTAAFLRETFAKIRSRLPNATLRTTVMVGFPGETEEEFETLCRFVKEICFDRLGCFIFSAERGTPAYRLPDRIDPAIAQERYDRIMAIQQEIAMERNQKMLGSSQVALVEGVADDGIFYTGRLPSQAPDVDDVTYIISEHPLSIGQRCSVKIVEADHYELTGVVYEPAQ